MKRTSSLYILFILVIPIFLVVLDQWLKYLIPDLIRISNFLFLSFADVHNEGFILGGFAKLDPLIRIIYTSTLLGFLYFIFSIFQYLLVPKVFLFRFSLSLMIAGMAGNAIDRAFFGYVRDYISLMKGIYFNFADVVLAIGFIFTIISLFKDKNLLWHPQSMRKEILINPKQQFSFSGKMTLIVFAFSLTFSIFSIAFFKSVAISQKELLFFAGSVLFLTAIFLIITFISGIFISHRSIGPLYAFEKFIDDIIAGKDRSLKLREGDNYKHLETIAEKIRTALKHKKKEAL